MQPSSSSAMESKAQLNKRLKTGEPSRSPSPSPSPYIIISNSSWSTSTTEPSGSTGTKAKSKLAKLMETGELMPVEFFNQTILTDFRFEPNDHQLLEYLRKKILRIQMPAHHIIEVNVYAHTPEYLADTYNTIRKNVWYFFTPVHIFGSESLNWKASGPSTPITKDGELLGFKKPMDYFQGNEKSDWGIVEYTLNMEKLSLPMPKHDDHWILCELFRKSMLNKFIPQQIANEEVDQNFVTSDF